MRTPESDALQSRLFQAVLDSSAEKLKTALQEGARPNVCDHAYPDLWRLFSEKLTGSFLLYEAVSLPRRRKLKPQSLESIKTLIEYGADVKMADDEGYTALHQAAAFNQSEVMSLLLGAGADLNARSAKGYTPLHTAIFGDSEAGTMMLLQAGANLNTVNEQGLTPHQYACKLNRSNVRSMVESYLSMQAIAKMLLTTSWLPIPQNSPPELLLNCNRVRV